MAVGHGQVELLGKFDARVSLFLDLSELQDDCLV